MSNLEKRKQLLFDDPDISKVEPHRVYCNRCNKWLKLDEVKLYAASVWRCHKNTQSHISRPHVSSATPSCMSEEDRLSSSTNQKNASDPLSTSLLSEDGRSNLKISSESRVSIGDTSRFRSTDTASVSSFSSAARDMSVVAANIAPNDGNEGANPHMVLALREVPSKSNTFTGHEGEGLLLPVNSSTTMPGPQPMAEPSNITNQAPEQTSLMDPFKLPPVSRMLSTSDKDMQVTKLQTSSPEQVSPQRKASHRALMAEPYIGKLEPYRAFCTSCSVWVNLSSRTPYSYGVWKGHIRKCDEHKILQTSNADDEYNTGSDHSQEEGIANKQFVQRSKSESEATALQADAILEGNSLMMKSDPEPSLFPDTKVPLGSATLADVLSPQGSKPNEERPTQILANLSVDYMIQSEKDFSELTPEKETPLLGWQHRRQKILSDPNAAVVKPRKVKCGICDRWIKGSTTHEYSLSHWFRHCEICIHNREDAAIIQQFECEDDRRDLLEKDPDIKEVEHDKVLCAKCDAWVRLHKRCRYSLKQWLRHKRTCPAIMEEVGNVSASLAVEEDDVNHLNNAAFVNAEIVTDKVKHENITRSREGTLRADPGTSEVDSYRVRCKCCNLWVDFNAGVPYSLTEWESHRKECHMATFRPKSHNDAMELDVGGHAEEPSGGKDVQIDGDFTVATITQDGVIRAEMTIARYTFLFQQPDILRVEAHRVMCGRCLSWIGLKGHTIFAPEEWLRHKDDCPGVPMETSHDHQIPDGQRSKPTFRGHTETDVRLFRGMPKGKGKEKGIIIRRAPSPKTLPPLPPRPQWPGEEDRKQRFIEDPDVIKIEPHRLLCKSCNCWIRLHPIIRYSLSIWPKHKVACKSSQTTIDARMTAKSEKEDIRRQMLEEDPYVTGIGPHCVGCKACGTNIRLHTRYTYDGSHWRAHRARCPLIPFADRSRKKRKGDGLQHESLNFREQVAPGHPSDSDVPDASSAPRPQPTAFFTAPLEVNPTKMFKQDSHQADLSAQPTVKVLPFRREAELSQRLQELAMDLDTSNRLNMVIESSGDVDASFDKCFGQDNPNDLDRLGDNDYQMDGMQRQLLSSNTEEPWVPRKRTREEEEEFNAIFERWSKSLSPRPKGSEICKLSREGLKVLE